MARHEQQPRPRPPEKPAPPKPTERPELEKAKKTIEKATSRDYKVRAEIIEELRSRPFVEGSLEDTKKAIGSLDKVSWLLKSADDIQYSAEAAKFAADIASAGDLADDPRWLLSKTIELAYSARADATEDVRREINRFVAKAGEQIKEQLQKAPAEGYQGIKTTSFDEAVHGGPIIKGMLDKDSSMFDEDNPEDETITDPELIRVLRTITSKIQTDRGYFSGHDPLKDDIQAIQKLERSGVPRNQIKEAIDRLYDIQKRATAASDRAQVDSRGREFIRYEDVKEWIPAEDRVSVAERGIFPFYHLTHDQIAMLRNGEEGAREFFYKFVTDIFSMGRVPEKQSLMDEQKFDEFINFMKWSHPKNTDYYTQMFEYVWREMPKHNQIVKNLLFTPGDIRDKLKNLQYLSPADLDHYSKNFRYANYAQSFYEEAVMDLLSERKAKYLQALEELKGGGENRLLNEYRELAGRRKARRLSVEEETRYQQLMEKMDVLGYGVNLWDTDIQNYTELDLQIGELNKEYDALKVRQEREKQEGKDLSKADKDRMEFLQKQIVIKQGSLERFQTGAEFESERIRQSQSDNRGLSKIDIDVKERLRLFLKNRGAETDEWELNLAVWAARQWEIGSSRLVSISSGMATRPAFELKHLGDAGIEIGKYVMRAPAFEDLQRVINPELFQDRFGMGDVIGETFRALTDKSLLEAKKYTFKHDPQDVRPEEAGMDKTLRETREFIRQVQRETGIPYTELVTQGIFQAGGIFDQTSWRMQIATLDQMRMKYAQMQQNGELPAGARLDNQGLGIQMLANKDAAGKQELMDRMVRRDPSKLYFFLNKKFDDILGAHGLSEMDRHRFRQALSAAQVDTWDTKQMGDRGQLAFRDVDMTAQADFDLLVHPLLKLQGFSEELIGRARSGLSEAKNLFDQNVSKYAQHAYPFTLSINDVDWSDASMFQTGNISVDRRGRDMNGMAEARNAWIAMETDPALLFGRDTKETLKKLKEFRQAMNSYTTGGAAEKATYELAKSWIHMNRNRMIHNDWDPPSLLEHPVDWVKSLPRAIPGAAKSALTWVPGVQTGVKMLSELDTSGGLIVQVAKLKIGERHVFGKAGEKVAHWMETKPRELSQNISYAVRFTGPHGNAWDEKQIDEVLDQLLQMGIFNAEEELYHKLRREMKASIGNQVVGMIRKYWWLLPILAAAFGAKEGVEEEKKH